MFRHEKESDQYHLHIPNYYIYTTMDHHSTNSKHSTPRYRAVSANSEVDESLFGRSNSGTLKNTGRRIVTGPVAPNAVVISQHELDRLKVRSIHSRTPFERYLSNNSLIFSFFLIEWGYHQDWSGYLSWERTRSRCSRREGEEGPWA